MDILKTKGFVHFVGKTEEFGSGGFAKRLLVICDSPLRPRPDYAAFEAKRGRVRDRTALLDGLKQGDAVTVEFVPEAREWKDPRTGATRWFASLALVGLARDGGGAEAAQTTAPQTQGPAQAATAAIQESDPGELPF